MATSTSRKGQYKWVHQDRRAAPTKPQPRRGLSESATMPPKDQKLQASRQRQAMGRGPSPHNKPNFAKTAQTQGSDKSSQRQHQKTFRMGKHRRTCGETEAKTYLGVCESQKSHQNESSCYPKPVKGRSARRCMLTSKPWARGAVTQKRPPQN